MLQMWRMYGEGKQQTIQQMRGRWVNWQMLLLLLLQGESVGGKCFDDRNGQSLNGLWTISSPVDFEDVAEGRK